MSKKRVSKETASASRRPAASGGRRLSVVLGAAAMMASLMTAIMLWPDESRKTPQAYTLASESALPAIVRQAPSKVQEAYRFAIANREILRYIPCYCGCGAEGHTSNASCYLKDFSTPENLVFDFMSLN